MVHFSTAFFTLLLVHFWAAVYKESREEMVSILKWCFWYGRDKEKWVDNFIDDENKVTGELTHQETSLDGLSDKLNVLLRLEYGKIVCDNVLEHGKTILDNKKLLLKWAGDKNKVCIEKFIEDIKEHLYPGVLSAHLGVSGVYKVWNGLKEAVTAGNNKLLILSEFREEMGSFRNKVAKLLNDELAGNQDMLKCFTSDIGMAIKFIPETKIQTKKTKIQCSVCNHDNDLYSTDKESGQAIPYPEETFHSPDKITEVCIKGESEGMFYLCPYHETGPRSLFIERMDNFDLFNVEEFSL